MKRIAAVITGIVLVLSTVPLTAAAVRVDGAVLAENTDYTVAYENNLDAGTASMVITGIGNYKDAVTRTFEINRAVQSVTAKAAASSVAAGRTVTVSAAGAQGKVTYNSSDTAVATVNAASGVVTAKKPGTVRITAAAAETANYSAASTTVIIKVVPAATSSLTAVNKTKGITLTWKKVPGATGYLVCRGSTKIATIKKGGTVTYTDTKANTNGEKYTFKIVKQP